MGDSCQMRSTARSDRRWPNVQVIVVDDGSTDESRLLLESYGNAIQTVCKENGGQASAVNAGFPLVTGDAVVLLDADDMLDPTAVERTIGFFADPTVVKVHWPMAVVNGNGQPTGEIRFSKLPSGSLRDHALKVGPASHMTPSGSGNFWRRSFLDQVIPIPDEDFRNIVDAYLFAFSPFFGEFRNWPEPLTFYRVHGTNDSRRLIASVRLEHWESRANTLHAWLASQGIAASIPHWRRRNKFYLRLKGILRGEAQIGKVVPLDAPIVLVAGPYYDRKDIRPARPVYRPPDELRSPDRTEADYRAFIDDVRAMNIEYITVQGRGTRSDNNLGLLGELLRNEHEALYEDKWIVIAKMSRGSGHGAS